MIKAIQAEKPEQAAYNANIRALHQITKTLKWPTPKQFHPCEDIRGITCTAYKKKRPTKNGKNISMKF